MLAVILLWGTAVLTGLSVRRVVDALRKPSLTPRVPTRSVVSSSIALREIWRRPGLTTIYSDLQSGLVGTQGYAAIVTTERAGESPNRIYVLDAGSGELRWRSDWIPYVHSLVINGDSLVAVVNWEVRSYGLLMGELKWKSGPLPDHAGYRIDPTPSGQIAVYSIDDTANTWMQTIRFFDANTGTLIRIDSMETKPDIFLVQEGRDPSIWVSRTKLWASTSGGGEPLWEYSLDGRVSTWPIEYGGLLLFAAGTFANVEAIELATGNLAWESERQFVSNIDLNASLLYGISMNGSVIALDASSGAEIGAIRTEPALTEMDSRKTAYWIEAFGDTVLAYFGDSMELIAFAPN